MSNHYGFGGYNIKAHNRVLGQMRTDRANRRNAPVIEALRKHEGPLPTDLAALRVIVEKPHGWFPGTTLLRLARQVRRERAATTHAR